MKRPFNVVAYVLAWWPVFVIELTRGEPLQGLLWATAAGLTAALLAPIQARSQPPRS